MEQRIYGGHKKELSLGMVGYKFMGMAQFHAYRDAPFFFDLEVKQIRQAICGRNEKGVKEAARKFGWISYETDWNVLIARERTLILI
ncbi:Gfo/Idh/MocA family oxidoreductase [Lederbergia lenta]|uniref:Oxidoreductase n=1 Tax=Lederbergia lenta TaxID=1467 RepID=A0A2X4VT63_LEDLE|nr:hypothetical protein [Lederbergia lenta]MCM3111206.1 hypothetical protein [Lederbergia lenta]MEC2325406.1 hypothetical protein [Lederbergia lenta]SQI55447.1 oxidoreductase [Lederbergia lenta]